MGETWQTSYKSFDNQHVHHITTDKHTGWVYAGLDGFGDAVVTKTRCIVTKDNGVTWTDIEIPYPNADYGLTYFAEDFRLGNGETTILGGNTIYRTEDNINFEVVLKGFQGVRTIRDINGRIIAGGNAGQSNRVVQLYSSTDKGFTWNTIYAENWLDTNAAGAGVRYFSDVSKPLGATENQMIIGGNASEYKPLRVFEGGNNYHALVYIDVGELPIGGKTIKVKYGHSVKFPKRLTQKDLSIDNSLIFRLKIR